MPNEMTLTLSDMPLTLIAEHCVAHTPFIHRDRTLAHHVLTYVYSGHIEVYEDGARYLLEAGDLILLRAGVRHWGQLPCAPGTRWTYVHFLLPQADTDCTRAYPLPVRDQEFRAEDYAHTLTLPKCARGLSAGGIAHKLERMVTLFSSANPLRAAYLNATLLEALLDLHALANPLAMQSGDPVTLAMLHMEKHMLAPFSAAALAQASGRSYKYLCALFRDKTGMSPQGYHSRLRMSAAARLLRETQRTVTEISDAFGFCNPQYFSRVFFSVYHMPPRAYRERLMRASAKRIGLEGTAETSESDPNQAIRIGDAPLF